MPNNHEWQSRSKAVEREYAAAKQAMDRFSTAAFGDATILKDNLRHGEIMVASANLEGTYIIRLFAEFESGTREYWRTNRKSVPTAAGLLDGLASKRRIPDTQLKNAHLVREHRNRLVHEREDELETLSIAEARHYLCQFFSSLPLRW